MPRPRYITAVILLPQAASSRVVTQETAIALPASVTAHGPRPTLNLILAPTLAPTLTLTLALTRNLTLNPTLTLTLAASQDKVLGLEAEVAALQDRLRALELERAQHRAQLEALSQHVTSRNDSTDLGPQAPAGASGRPAEVRT